MDAFSLGEELLIVDGDKLKQRPWEEVERVQDFLGIPQVVTSQVCGRSYYKHTKALTPRT